MPPLAVAAALAAAALAAAIAAPWDRGVDLTPLVHDASPSASSASLDVPAYARTTVHFPLNGGAIGGGRFGRQPPRLFATPVTWPIPLPSETGEAWLYLPKGLPANTKPPVLIMGHGIGGQKEMGLHSFAAAFAEKGIACFVLDYRCFGGSTGEPRNWASPSRHVADFVAAARWVKANLGASVDTARAALWGSSLAGGHAIAAAAVLGDEVAAVVSQVPHLSGRAASRASLAARGPAGVARLARAGLHDVARSLAGLGPAYVTLAGRKGDLAFMQLEYEEERERGGATASPSSPSHTPSRPPHSEAELAEYFSKHPAVYQGGWQNRIRARFALDIARYSPGDALPAVTAPVLMIVATRDTQCPPGVARELAGKNKGVTLVEIEAAHFEVYRGDAHAAAVAAEAGWLAKTLGV